MQLIRLILMISSGRKVLIMIALFDLKIVITNIK
jgi:hypothetical protein